MGSKLIFGPWILVVLTNPVFGVGTAEMEGPSLTLHTDGQESNQIFWKFGPQNWIIARCRKNKTPRCERLQTDELIDSFRDRLKIDDHDGSLTIMNISDEQAGLYTLQIFSSNKKDEKKFNVSISPPKTANNSKCSCVQHCLVENVTRVTLSWNISSTCPFLEVEYQDTNGTCCVVNSSVTDQTKQDCQCMSPRSDSGLNPGYIALICVLVVLVGVAVAAAAVIFYKKCKTGRNDSSRSRARDQLYIVQVTEPLTVDTECAAYHYEKKNGSVSSINSHPEERRSLRIIGEQ